MIYYYWWESVIPKEICDHIINTAPWENSCKGRVLSEKLPVLDEESRKAEVVSAPRLSLAECILRSYITEANKASNWNAALTDVEHAQIIRYADGGHYDYHVDADVLSQKKIDRKLSAVLFLSNPTTFEGGEFEFKSEDIFLQNKRLPQGSILVFPSFLEHRVTPVTSGERYTAVCWAIGPSFK